MKKIISAIISSPLNGRLCGLLFAFLATTTLWAYDFQFGDLYYNITSDTTVEVTYIEYYSSSNYANLATATIPESVIYNGTTYSVTSIGSEAFFGCSSLTSITIPNSVTSIGELVFAHCTSLTSITIPNSVMSIGYGIFLKCVSLTIPIYNANCFAFLPSTFEGAYTILEGIKHIAGSAFSRCASLTSLTIPSSVTSIGYSAFANCSSLTTIICKTTEVPKLEDEVFFNIPLSGATLYVPVQSLDDYKAAEQWKDFGTILPIEEEEHEEKIELQDTEMTIVFTNSEDNDSEIYCQPITIKVPTAPAIEGFTFLYWQPVAEPITNEITIQAIYEADTPTATEVYINPANPTQKLLRNGQLYILKDGKTYNIMGAEFK